RRIARTLSRHRRRRAATYGGPARDRVSGQSRADDSLRVGHESGCVSARRVAGRLDGHAAADRRHNRRPHRERHVAAVAARRIRTPGAHAGRNSTMIPARDLRRWCGLMVALAMFLGHARPALAYLKFGFEANGREVTLKWTTTPVRYFVTNQGVSGVTATDFQTAVAQAFATWQA